MPHLKKDIVKLEKAEKRAIKGDGATGLWGEAASFETFNGIIIPAHATAVLLLCASSHNNCIKYLFAAGAAPEVELHEDADYKFH